jgi:hypothetical protein
MLWFGRPPLAGHRSVAASCSGPVGHDHRAVRELDLVARAAMHDRRGRDDLDRPAVGTHQPVAPGDLAHRGPAVRCRQRGVQGERLADARPGRDDDHLARVQAIGHGVQILEAGRHAEGQPAGFDGLQLVHGWLQQVLERHEVLAGR